MLEQQTNQRNPIPAGVKIGAVELVRALPESFIAKCATGEDIDAFCRLIYRFTVNKNDTEIIRGENTGQRTFMMKRAKGRIVRYSKSKPDDFREV